MFFKPCKMRPHFDSFSIVCPLFQVSVPPAEWKVWEISRTASRNWPHYCKINTKSLSRTHHTWPKYAWISKTCVQNMPWKPDLR